MSDARTIRLLVATTFNDRPDVAVYRGLARAGFRMDLMCLAGARDWDVLERDGIRVTQRTARNRLDLPVILRIRRLLKSEPFDIVYAPRNNTLSVCLLATLGLPVKVAGYRGTMGHLHYYDPASRLTYLNGRVDRLVCVSEAVRQYLLGMGLPAGRLVTIHKGHDPAWYAGQTAPDLSEFGIPANAVVVGFVGNMRPVKGVDILLKAAALAPAEFPIHYLMVGEVRDRSILRLAQDPRIRNRVHFAGFRKDAAALAGRCHVFVMPSVEREGLPRAAIEAMAQGVATIVSDVGGMPELVVDRECGLVVPPRDPAALAAAIGTLARDANLRKAYGEKARERIHTDFHIQRTIDKTIALFRELAPARS